MPVKAHIPDVLADRYASPEMAAIWSAEGKIRLERELWIAVLRAQRTLGVDIPEAAIADYEKVVGNVDLDSIRERERRLRHDVKARIEEFCELAGHEHIHKGLTSRDLTENVEQLQVMRSLELVRTKAAASLARLADRAREWRSLVITARTHNVPAQATTFGRRLAMFGEDLLHAFQNLEQVAGRYPLRGIKGAVGTQLDQITLLGSPERAAQLESAVAGELGFRAVLGAVGQVYPRSLDVEVVSALFELGAAPSNFARTVRLMTGFELASEGFQKGQVGSSAMPHKMNARSCERINGFQLVLNGFLNMVLGLAGDQWNEGDVSCSVVRRVALPGAMFTIDGLLDTFCTVLRELTLYPAVIAAERERHLPFLATTTILMEAVKRGAGRESAHGAIREHSLAVADDLRAGRTGPPLLDRLAADSRVGMSRSELEQVLGGGDALIGAAVAQTDDWVARAEAAIVAYPQARSYEPPPLL